MLQNSLKSTDAPWQDELHLAARHLHTGNYQAAFDVGHALLRHAAHVPELHFILASVLFHEQRYDQAMVFVRQALEMDPQNVEFHVLLGRILLESDQLHEAGRALEVAYSLDSTWVDAHYWWVESFRRRGQSHLLISHLAKNYGDRPSAIMALISALLDMGDRERAFSVLHGAVTTHESFTEYLFQFAHILGEFHQYSKSARILRWLADRDPANEPLHAKWLEVVWKEGNIKEIRRASRLATDRFPNSVDFNQIRFEAHAQSQCVPEEEIEQANRRFAIRYCNSRPQPTHPARYAHERPRVGYIVENANVRVLEAILTNHSPERFDIFVYTNDKSVTEFGNTQVRSICETADAIANQMSQDEIDILITMSHHATILDLLALRPVALQGSWMCTTRSLQLPYLDFVVADRNLIGLEERDDWSEHVLELPIWAPYCFPDTSPEIQCRSENDPVVFGVFQKRSQINHRMLRVWAEILRRVPLARLKFHDAAYSDPHVSRAVLREAASAGIPGHRLDLEPKNVDTGCGFEVYQDIDICLDVSPFGLGLGVLDALWMGIPVVTQTGDFFSSRIPATFLKSIGRDNWVARSTQDYADIAAQLANDSEQLMSFRQSSRTDLEGSLTSQGQVVTTLLETRLSQMHRAAQRL